MASMKVVVIGNGIGGFSAASTIRRLDEQCDVKIISTETIPLYSACVLPDYISGKISRERMFVKTDTDYKQLGIGTLFGYEVKEIDPTVKKVTMNDGRALPFDRLILATGSEAIVFGELKKGVFTIKTLNHADEIIRHRGKKAVVLGSGAIGIEVAIALHCKEYEVTIIEMLERVLPLGLDQKGANKVKEILEEEGIKVLNGERAVEVLGQERVDNLVTDKRELDCDTLVWAIGMRPRLELARQCGITIGENAGISVDSHMETSVSGIYACGDCVETNDVLTGEPCLNLFWQNANRQGSVAAYNCLGFTKEYPGSHKILNIDVFGNRVVGFGYTEESLYRLTDIKAFDGKLDNPSIIEREKGESYYRLVIVGDRCIGGQFINIEQHLGLLWSIMVRRKSIKELLTMLENEELMYRRPWFHQVRPFLKPVKLN